MITPELVGYIRGEFAKGKTREEIHKVLVSDGGWSEIDLNEAFRTVIPMQPQGFTQSLVQNSLITKIKSPSPSFSPSPSPSPSSSKKNPLIFIIILIIIGGLGAVLWFYRVPVMSLWNSLPYFGTNETSNIEENVTIPQNIPVVESTEIAEEKTENVIKDCGVSVAPDLKNPSTYEKDAVLTCLGNSALRCEDVTAVLTDALFPTIFQIIKNQDTCNFKLSYAEDSTLIDITGKKLAGQYILCPISLVSITNESTTKSPIFQAFNENSLSKYASQIYLYGTLGLFTENNVDQNKIQALGCSGPYIDSVVASYRKTQPKR